MKHTTGDQKLIDLHCDTLSECHKRGIGLNSVQMPHFALDRLPEGLRLCQALAIFMPDEYRGEDAQRYFDAVYAVYQQQMAVWQERITPVTDLSTISGALDATQFAALLTVEGGSALAGQLDNVDRLYDLGVRMMTLTWNAANEICGGVATDQGFTPWGKQVIGRMEERGMVVDVSHLSDTGFWELCDFATRPFAASHSNARAVCGHRRNLTDDMFREMVRQGGIVGLNYYETFITDDLAHQSMDDLLRHVHHFLALGGENTLALGSDFDGADLPPYLDGLDKIEYLIDALERSGIPTDVVDRILFHNANHFFGNPMGGNNDEIH